MRRVARVIRHDGQSSAYFSRPGTLEPGRDIGLPGWATHPLDLQIITLSRAGLGTSFACTELAPFTQREGGIRVHFLCRGRRFPHSSCAPPRSDRTPSNSRLVSSSKCSSRAGWQERHSLMNFHLLKDYLHLAWWRPKCHPVG